jgi:hypothetical protein
MLMCSSRPEKKAAPYRRRSAEAALPGSIGRCPLDGTGCNRSRSLIA